MRDFVYVEDAVKALMLAMKSANIDSQIFNVCTGIGTTILKLAENITQIRGVPFLPQYKSARAADVRLSTGDPRKAIEKLSFKTHVSLEEGLAKTIKRLFEKSAR